MNHPELEGIYTWDWVPDNRALDRLRDAIRDEYHRLRSSIGQLSPERTESKNCPGPSYRPSLEDIKALGDALQEEYRDAWTMLETLDPGNPAIKNRTDPSATPSPQEIEELRKAVLKTYRKIRTSPQPKATTSPVITPNELENKTVEEITEIARQKGLILSKMDGKNIVWRDPVTGEDRLLIDHGHVTAVGMPYNNPNAAVDHVHGYGSRGRSDKISDPQTGDTHFPLRKSWPQWLKIYRETR